MSKIKGFQFFFDRLLRGFRSVKNREPNNLEMILIKQEAGQKAKDANKVINVDFDQGRWKDAKPDDSMTGITTDIENRMGTINKANDKIKKLLEEREIMYGKAPKTPPYEKSQADIEFEILERIKADNKKAVEAFEKRNPKPPKKFFYGGFVEQPELGPTAHGSEALASRTRLAAPGSTSTTSTGLNYLLAEDNDNQRVPFGKGKLADVARRKFLKMMGVGAAGVGAAKAGLIGLGEKTAPMVEAATETIKQAPSYFFDLASTIKMFGKKSKVQIQDRIDEYSMPSKDGKSELMLTEDVGTGEMQIKKIGKENDEMVSEVQTMEYSPGAARADESTKGTPADDYQEYTEYNSRIYKDEYNDPDVVDGINVEDITKELIETKTKKASGGLANILGE